VDNVDLMSALDAGPVLRRGWDDMPVGCRYLEVRVFSAVENIVGGSEAASVLAAAFSSCVPDAFQSFSTILHDIEVSTQYTV
jgi:hypothetical protein